MAHHDQQEFSHPQQCVVTDRVGFQMLHDYEPRLLFRLISGRRGESPWHPERLQLFLVSAWLQARVARSSYLLAISRIVCSSRESRISFAMARACAASFSQVAEFSMVHLPIARPAGTTTPITQQ